MIMRLGILNYGAISGRMMSEKLKEVIGGFKKDSSNLVPILQKIHEVEKQLTPEAISEVSCFLDISQNAVYSVASFYPQFRLAPDGGE